MAQEQVQRKKSERKAETETPPETKSAQEKGEDLKSAIDDILADIDEILNEESVEMVANFVQKGGE